MKITPLGERVLLKPVKTEEKTESGIYLPPDVEEKKQGIVEQTGTFKDGSKLPLSKGEKVLYGGYSQEEFEINNEKYLIIDYKNIIAKLEE